MYHASVGLALSADWMRPCARRYYTRERAVSGVTVIPALTATRRPLNPEPLNPQSP